MFKYSNSGFFFSFDVSEERQLNITDFSITQHKKEEALGNYNNGFELQISGENTDAHHGAKHIGTFGSKMKYKTHSFYKNEFGDKLEIALENKGIEAVLHYQFYNNISVVRAWSEITNLSENEIVCEYVSSFSYIGINKNPNSDYGEYNLYLPHNSTFRENYWTKSKLSDYGIIKEKDACTNRIVISNTGTWSSKEYLPVGILENTDEKAFYMWQIENNGSWNWEISDDSEKLYLKLSGPSENENDWVKILRKNESFESVKTAIALGDSLDSAIEAMTSYRRIISHKNEIENDLPIIFNDYLNCLDASPTTEKEIPLIDKAALLGAEYYVMDAGWYAEGTWWEEVGEWLPCDSRFKNGIKEVFDYIKSKGMIPGIWLEIEVMGINCPLAKKLPNDWFFVRHGKRVIDHGRYQLDFRNKQVREYASKIVDRVINEYGIGYIKFDYNIDAGLGTEINSDSFGDGLLEHNRCYLNWLDSITEKYPDLVIENCSSGGMRMDYAMLSHCSLQSITDQYNAKKSVPISAMSAISVIPEQASVWVAPTLNDTEDDVVTWVANAMLSRFCLSGKILDLSKEKEALIKEGTECYKSIRANIKNGIPYYPVGIFNDSWYFRAVKSGKKHYACIWKNGVENKFNANLKNIKEAKILYPKNSDIECKCTDSELTISFGNKYSSCVIEYGFSDSEI